MNIDGVNPTQTGQEEEQLSSSLRLCLTQPFLPRICACRNIEIQEFDSVLPPSSRSLVLELANCSVVHELTIEIEAESPIFCSAHTSFLNHEKVVFRFLFSHTFFSFSLCCFLVLLEFEISISFAADRDTIYIGPM